MKILVIAEDSDQVRPFAKDLRIFSMHSRSARSARSALDSLVETDAVLICFGPEDPVIDRVRLCRVIRASSDIPIVALVDNPKIGRHILGLHAGVDDYLCRPYRAATLVTRLDEIYRDRSREPEPPEELRLDDVTIDFRRRTVTVAGRTLQLTNRQYQILALLAEHQGAVCTKDALISRIWGRWWHGADQSLYVHINMLRGKIGRPTLIENVRGAGYRLTEPRAMAS